MLVIMDILFFIFVPGSWMTYQDNNSVWNGLRGMHGFSIFLSVITFLLKVIFITYVDSPFVFYIHVLQAGVKVII